MNNPLSIPIFATAWRVVVFWRSSPRVALLVRRLR